jgi:hypothetical protein
MAEKSAKNKPKKAADPGVLGNLSPTRPTRLGGERRTAATAAAAKTTAATKPKAAPKKKPVRASAPKQADAKAAKLRKPEPAPPAGWQTPGAGDRAKSGRPSGGEIVTTAVQAAGELAQIGVTMGGQLLKRAAGRIPRP